MAYIHSNPWQDAAAYGGALGDKLAEALIYRKQAQNQQAAQASYRNAELGLEQRRVASEEKQAGQRAQYENSLLEIRRQHEQEIGQYHQALEQATHEKNLLGQQLSQSMIAHRQAQARAMEVEDAYKRQLTKASEQKTGQMGDALKPSDKVRLVGTLGNPTFDPDTLKANAPEAYSWLTNQFNPKGQAQAPVQALPSTNAPQRKFRYDPATGQLVPAQ